MNFHCAIPSLYRADEIIFYLVVLRMETVLTVEMIADQRYAIKSTSHGDIHPNGVQFDEYFLVITITSIISLDLVTLCPVTLFVSFFAI